jgi:glutathione peroxidase
MIAENSIYQFQCKNHQGGAQSLSDFTGQVLLIVNTASKCGFTPQYQGLETLHQTYKEQGFSVLGFPCNQFGSQEPGSDEEIQTFCSTNFQLTFPVFAKVEVNGMSADPLYQFLTNKQPGLVGSKKIKWNFTKFLINRNGQPVKRFSPTTTPEKLTEKIEDALS